MGIAHGGKWNESNAISELMMQFMGNLQTQMRFADSSSPGERQQADLRLPQESAPLLERLLTANEYMGRERKHCPRFGQRTRCERRRWSEDGGFSFRCRHPLCRQHQWLVEKWCW